MDDIRFMEEAIRLAEKAEGFTSPNPTVGAVVVKNGRIVGRGWHEAAGRPHAEVVALDEAGSLGEKADLYVTLEPCNHTGRTPPCTEKIIRAGIARVVFAVRDPNPNVTGGGRDFLKSRGIEVVEGVCREAAEKQIEWFLKFVRTKKPFVTLKCAMTLDGRVATRTGDSRWVTGEAARRYVHRLRHAADAIMVGAGTVKADNPRLTARLGDRPAKDPLRVILDSRLTVDENAAVFNVESTAATLVVTGPAVDGDKKERLEYKGVRVIPETLDGDGRIRLPDLMARLGALNITSLLIEGGGRVSGAALKAGIVDKICFFYAPKILGGDDGVPACSGTGPEWMKDVLKVSNMTVSQIGDDIMVEGYLN
ncbi:MAG: bifunctional diaminohydroxyphosphoribosylaminopyrimidine deaminase/5-amino-6-(5-phosphoribosylamino)uracil reductase RibD [Thermodesulfobacteriota bacterium]